MMANRNKEFQKTVRNHLVACVLMKLAFTEHYRAADGGQPAVIRVRK
jgi:hypothetical protein